VNHSLHLIDHGPKLFHFLFEKMGIRLVFMDIGVVWRLSAVLVLLADQQIQRLFEFDILRNQRAIFLFIYFFVLPSISFVYLLLESFNFLVFLDNSLLSLK